MDVEEGRRLLIRGLIDAYPELLRNPEAIAKIIFAFEHDKVGKKLGILKGGDIFERL